MDEEREAITTGLQNLWPQVPNSRVFTATKDSLLFKHNEDDKDVSLIEFFSSVDKTLTQRGHLSLKYLGLATDYGIKFKSQVNNLIRYASSCNVEQFWLLLSHIGENKESDDLFEIDSESFFVNSCFIYLNMKECMFNPSGTVSWINLRFLIIKYGKFDEVLIQNILSGSPLLESLVIDNCKGFRRIDITSNSVKRLVLTGSMHTNDELKDVGNIITINAPHLLSLEIEDEFRCKLMLLNVSSLVKAYLDYKMDVPNKEHEEEDMLARFILSLGHAKEFKIGKDCLKALSRLEAKGFTLPSNIKIGLPNLWTVVPNLVFKHDEDDKDVSLIEFFSSVDKTITQRGHLNLVKFILDTDYSIKFKSLVNNLISYAISCNVQQFWLLLDHADEEPEWEFELNSESFFVNLCFTHLYLQDCMFNPNGAVSWINLKSLCIRYGTFDEVLIQNILSGCPLLETIIIDNCYGFRRIDITSNSVKNLVFSGSMDDELEDVGNIITINAPHILSLKIQQEFCCELMLLDMSSLVKAYLDYTMDVPNKEQEEEDMLKRFILRLRDVKELRIGKHCLKALSRLEAKGFIVPSNMKKYPDSNSTKSGDWDHGLIDYARCGDYDN